MNVQERERERDRGRGREVEGEGERDNTPGCLPLTASLVASEGWACFIFFVSSIR